MLLKKTRIGHSYILVWQVPGSPTYIWGMHHLLWLLPIIYENINKALELDPDLPEAHSSSAMIAQLMEWNWEKRRRSS